MNQQAESEGHHQPMFEAADHETSSDGGFEASVQEAWSGDDEDHSSALIADA